MSESDKKINRDEKNIVEVQNVSKTYNSGKVSVEALKHVDLIVRRGEFMALAGPSGSGKTTLLNLIGGLDNVSEGTINIAGQNICEMKRSELAKLRLHNIGFVFQSYNLIPVLTSIENVEFVMLLQGVPKTERREKAENILKEVGLEEYINRRPNEMSGGQQQRVAVARAVVSEPELVLADEPTANLDSKTGESLLQLMKNLNEERNITFIFSTHDQLVMEKAERLVRIRDGQIAGE